MPKQTLVSLDSWQDHAVGGVAGSFCDAATDDHYVASSLLPLLAAVCVKKPPKLFGHADAGRVGGEDKGVGLRFHRLAFQTGFLAS